MIHSFPDSPKQLVFLDHICFTGLCATKHEERFCDETFTTKNKKGFVMENRQQERSKFWDKNVE